MPKRTNAINQICTLVDTFSAADRRIAEYILNNPEDVEHLTVRALSEHAQTSPATVSRFARTLGYESFAELKIAVALSNEEDGAGTGTSFELTDFSASKRFVLRHKMAELEDTADFMDEDTFKRFLNQCQVANTVLIVGIGNTSTMAMNAAFKFTQVGIKAVAFPTIETSISFAENLTGSDALLVLSTSGYAKQLAECVDRAEERGAAILMITDNPASPLARRANLVLRTATRDFLLTTTSAFSHNSMNFVLELLYLYFLSSWNDAIQWSRVLMQSIDRQTITDA